MRAPEALSISYLIGSPPTGTSTTTFTSFGGSRPTDTASRRMHSPGNYIGACMRLDAVSVGRDPPNEVNVVVEVPVGGEPIKYEMDKASGALIVDRFLYTAMRYPGNYGFIPHTLSDDGDPCDVLVTNQRGIIPGAVLAVRPVGVLKMQDEAGGDEQIIAVPVPRLTRR